MVVLLPAAALPAAAKPPAHATTARSMEVVLCVPGPWADRSDFLRTVVNLAPMGRYLFAGRVLTDVVEKDHIPLEFNTADARLSKAFELSGRGHLSADLLRAVAQHRSIAFLRFPARLDSQRARILKFSRLLRSIGGIAVKVESAGVSHTWERWESLLGGTLFDQYTAAVTLVGDADFFYSCGMHNFGLADCEVPTSLAPEVAADLMNRFNYRRVAEPSTLGDGHTFSLREDSPRYRLHRQRDSRHAPDEAFFNRHGLWRLTQV